MTIKRLEPAPGSRGAYLDFEIQMFKSGGAFHAQVLDSPAGGTDIEELDFKSLRRELKGHFNVEGGRSSDSTRNVAYQSADSTKLTNESMKVVGTALFEFLFTNKISIQYYRSVDKARTEKKGLRLKLQIEARELSALPWEVIFDSNRERYIGLWNDTPIVRYIKINEPVTPLAVEPPLRILGLKVYPDRSLEGEKEAELIEEALKELISKNLIELRWAQGQTLQALEDELSKSEWHVLHFIGHGGFDEKKEGYIVLADDKGEPQPVEATRLAPILAPHESLRFAFLNSCDGARGSDFDNAASDFDNTATILIRAGIPAVLAMRSIVSDDAAIKFSRAFYTALANRWPVDAAVTQARKMIDGKIGDTPEWGTPVLYSRSPDGEIFIGPPHRNGEEGKSRLLKWVVATLMFAGLLTIIWFSFRPGPTGDKNSNKNIARVETPPQIKCNARITIDKILGEGIIRKFQGRVENAPEDGKVWLFRRTDGSELWTNLGQAKMTDKDWSIDAPIRAKDELRSRFEVAAVVSQEAFEVNQKVQSLPSQCVSQSESGPIPKPEFQITQINGASAQSSGKCAILQWQSNTFEGLASNVLENEAVSLIVVGYDSTHNQTGLWPGTDTVAPGRKWTVNIKVSDGKSFEIYVAWSEPVLQGIPLKCAGR